MRVEERGRAAGRATMAVFEASVSVHADYADLVRRRQHQRRFRTGALAVTTAAALVLGFSARGVLRADQFPPAAPPAGTPSAQPLASPLVAPTSLLDVRSLGFHVEPRPGLDQEGPGAGWAVDDQGQTVQLRWSEVGADVEVRVGYQGAPAPVIPSGWSRTDVTIHGRPGTFVASPERAGPPLGGSFEGGLGWQYAADSWAYVWVRSDRGDPGPERLQAVLTSVAEAVSTGGDPVRLPLRMPTLPESLPDPGDLYRVAVAHQGGSGWEARLDFGRLGMTVGLGSVPQACEARGGLVEEFTFRGHPGCTAGEGATDQPPPGTRFNFVMAVALQPDSTVRVVAPNEVGDWFSYHLAEWTQVLHDITVEPLYDRSAWVDVRTAVQG